jgi:4-amino-4-deoxy-L-arabinose transferase-like glycosyltransferase
LPTDRTSQHGDGGVAQSGTSRLRRRIVFDGTASPIKTALFVIICIAWLLPGLVGHDPWKPDEAMAMGVVHAMLNDGGAAWWLPQIAGVAHTDYPPLYFWVAALSAKLFAFALPLHDGARLASGFFMLLTIVYLYKAANKLIDERAGRIAVALLIGSLGLLLRAHEMNPEVAGLAGMSVALYGLTRIRSDAQKGGMTTGSGALIMSLSVGLVPSLVVPVIAATLMWILHDNGNRAYQRGIVIATAVLLIGSAIYPLILTVNGLLTNALLIDAILNAPLFDSSARSAIAPFYFLQLLPWYALPTLPIAIWLWRRERGALRERIELALPVCAFVLSLLWLSLLREGRDAVALILLLPLALAAAHALDRLPKGAASFIDWLGLVIFGLLALSLWLYWSAAVIGIPEAAARAVARAAPGFAFTFAWLPVLIAAALTLVWMYAVVMAHRNNRRAIVNWAAGITLLWVLANLLGLPAVDHVRSYRAPVAAIANHVRTAPSCVIGTGINLPQRAMFDYKANLRFVAANSPQASQCTWMLIQGTKMASPDIIPSWQLVWEGARPAERIEQFRLYRRN